MTTWASDKSEGPIDYARERHESQRDRPPLRDEIWTGNGWVDKPELNNLDDGQGERS